MGSFQDALRSRLNTIDEQGESQTTWERLANARKKSKSMQDQNLAWQQSINNRMQIASQNQANMPGYMRPSLGKGTNEFEALVRAISQKESNNNYGARNKSSGAMGKYQIMPGNLGGSRSGWDYEALGRDVTAAQFMASPQIQDQIARYKLQQYFNKYGAAGTAIAWYAGPGAANKYMNTGYVSRAAEGAYPSVLSYMNSILGRR